MGSRTCSELAVRIARLVSQKPQAGVLERQAAKLEQPPRLAGLVGHDVLVLHVQHAPGQHRAPVRHHPFVFEVVLAELREVVGEGLAARKQLPEARQAGVNRVATRVDEARVRQRQGEQADCREVVRHLVDESWRVASVLKRVVEVGATERGPVAGVEFTDGLGVREAILAPAAYAPHEAPGFGQLVGRVHLRVAAEDLLDQRRAGARQADHEDRRRVPVAGARMACEEGCVEHCTDPLVDQLGLHGVVALERAAQAIALGV